MLKVSAVLGAVFLILAPMPAFAHHKPNHRDFFSHHEETRVVARERDPCHAVSNNPHESNARQAMQRRCQRLSSELRERPDDAALREQCDRLARGLTGLPC